MPFVKISPEGTEYSQPRVKSAAADGTLGSIAKKIISPERAMYSALSGL
jgi:hypothetical protein